MRIDNASVRLRASSSVSFHPTQGSHKSMFLFLFLSDTEWIDSILSSMRKGACEDAESIFLGSNPVILAR